MNKNKLDSKGYIALLTVLIVGAASLAIALSVLLRGSESRKMAQAEQLSIQSRKLADACAEEALQQIHDSTSFTGTNNLTFSTGTCSYTVTNTGGSNRSITSSGNANGVVRKDAISATIGAVTISIVSWQETP